MSDRPKRESPTVDTRKHHLNAVISKGMEISGKLGTNGEAVFMGYLWKDQTPYLLATKWAADTDTR